MRAAPRPANVTLRRNNLAPNSVSGVNNTGGTTVAANCNWWGNASGPNPPGTGTGVSGRGHARDQPQDEQPQRQLHVPAVDQRARRTR